MRTFRTGAMTGPDAAPSMRRFDGEIPAQADVLGERPGRTLVQVKHAQRSVIAAVLVTTSFFGCAWLSWRRLGSLIIDGGHELDVPRRLLEGAALYRDVAWSWGPLAPFLNTALYGVFGIHSDTLMWAGLVSAGLAALGLYLLARCFVGPVTSGWVAVAFIVSCAFARRGDHALFNFVLPFNFSASYGITLGIWSVLLLVRHVRSGNPWTLAASSVLAGLVALTKVETAFAVAAAHGAFLLTVLPRPSRGRLLAWGCGALVAAASYALAARMSGGHVWHSVIGLVNGGSRYYIAESMGVREPGRSLLDVGGSLIAWAVVLAVTRWAAREDAGPRDRRLLVISWLVLLALPAFLIEATFFRAAPLLLAAGLAWIVLVRRREGEQAFDGEWRELLVVWAFALGGLPRILLRSGVDHYGFYLLPPTLACVAIGMTRLLSRRDGPALSRRTLGIAASTVLAGVALGAGLVAYPHLTRPVTEVRTARVHLLVKPDGPEATFIPYLSGLPASTVCAAVPEGTGIVFASRLTPPDDGMTAYIPMALHGDVQRHVLDAWKRKPPGVIVHWLEDQHSVFGYAGFGQDYGLELAAWISERYEVALESPDGRAVLLVPRQGG